MRDGEGLMTVVRSGHARSRRVSPYLPTWIHAYRIRAMLGDFLCAGMASGSAFYVRFGGFTAYSAPYFAVSVALPLLWICTVAFNRAYEPRLIGIGSEEFRRVVQCGVRADRRDGHRLLRDQDRRRPRLRGPRAAAGHTLHPFCTVRPAPLAAPAPGARARACAGWWRSGTPRRSPSWSSCSAGSPTTAWRSSAPACPTTRSTSGSRTCPVLGGFSDVSLVVDQSGADTVAVLACPEMDGQALRRLAWRLERDPDRPGRGPGADGRGRAADHASGRSPGCRCCTSSTPSSRGVRRLVKNVFDRVGAALLLVVPGSAAGRCWRWPSA